MDLRTEIEKFRTDWEIDFPQKLIRRRARGLLKRIAEFFVYPVYPVIALYRFAQQSLASEEGIVYPNFLERGKGHEVAGVPTWFELAPEWRIPAEDLQRLIFGPLVQGTRVLVPALPSRGFFTTVWRLISIVATIGSAVTFIAWLASHLLAQ